MSESNERGLENVEVIGVSHRTAPVDVLERLAMQPEEIDDVYKDLYGKGVVQEAVILSTCNRTEIYASAVEPRDLNHEVLGSISKIAGPERVPQQQHVYHARGRDSVEHLFRVACGLDSMILGEAQILGQVKAAYEACQRYGRPSPSFELLMQAAFKVARRSRSSTEIGRGAVSVASAAVHVATKVFSDLSRRTVLIVGAGDTGRLAAEHIARHGPKRLIIANRTLSRAQDAARPVNGEAVGLDALPKAMSEADVIMSAVGTREPIIDVPMVNEALNGRGGRMMALLDLGMPRNIAAGVNDLPDVLVQDLEAFKQVVDQSLARRRREVPKVEELIQSEIEKLHQRQRQNAVGPLIAAMRSSVEAMRHQEVAKAAHGLSEKERAAIERATRAVVNKFMHGPMMAIKEYGRQQEEGTERLELIRQMFGNLQLDEEE